jgi:hypothetical protein
MRALVPQEMSSQGFLYDLVPPSEVASPAPVLITALASDGVLMIPFEQLPERIQALWPAN